MNATKHTIALSLLLFFFTSANLQAATPGGVVSAANSIVNDGTIDNERRQEDVFDRRAATPSSRTAVLTRDAVTTESTGTRDDNDITTTTQVIVAVEAVVGKDEVRERVVVTTSTAGDATTSSTPTTDSVQTFPTRTDSTGATIEERVVIKTAAVMAVAEVRERVTRTYAPIYRQEYVPNTGKGASGIEATANVVRVTNNGEIIAAPSTDPVVTGPTSHGIIATGTSANTGDITIINNGKITTQIDNSHGITAANGKVNIINNAGATIETQGAGANAINAGGDENEITNSGKLETTNNNAVALKVDGSASTIINNISGKIISAGDTAIETAAKEITNSGKIEVKSGAGIGIDSTKVGTSTDKTTITNSGTINTQSGAGIRSSDTFANIQITGGSITTQGGDAINAAAKTIRNAGTLEVTTGNGDGIASSGAGTSDTDRATITTSGTISTQAGVGIRSTGNFVDINVTSGSITTASGNAILATETNANITNSGKLEVTGTATAVKVDGSAGTIINSLSGKIISAGGTAIETAAKEITNSGKIEVKSGTGIGIDSTRGDSSGDETMITQSAGSISTRSGVGINSIDSYANIQITGGSITTQGGDAINAAAKTIRNAGTLKVTTGNGDGIASSGAGTSDTDRATITTSGTISTQAGVGIRSTGDFVDIKVRDGSITTASGNAILATGTNANISNSGRLEVTGTTTVVQVNQDTSTFTKNNNDGEIISAGGTAIRTGSKEITNAGSITVNSVAGTTTSTGIGIDSTKVGTSTDRTTITNSGTISTKGGAGIQSIDTFADIQITGGSITTQGGDAINAAAKTINISAGTINVTGAGIGIDSTRGDSSGDETMITQSAGRISTQTGVGINSIDSYANIQITGGSITTQGGDAINAKAKTINIGSASILTVATGNGDGIDSSRANTIEADKTTITNSGAIFTQEGVGIKSVGDRYASIEVASGGRITTSGSNAHGIQTAGGNTENNGNITTNGANSEGIQATAANARVTNNSGATITSQGHGIYTIDANSEVTNDGNITTKGSDGYGIYTEGSNSAIVNEYKIVTEGDSAYGISSDDTSSTVEHRAQAQILTKGEEAHGIVFAGATFDNLGTITTEGVRAEGVQATGASAAITNSNNITSKGHGINATGATSTVVNEGTITTNGNNAIAPTEGSSAIKSAGTTITNNGMLETTSGGIGIESTNSASTVVNEGTITTNGSNASAIKSAGTTITNNEKIKTTGGGIGIESTGNNAVIRNNEGNSGSFPGTIETAAVAGAHGIKSTGSDATITNFNDITAGINKDASSGDITAIGSADGILSEGTDATIINELGKTITAGGNGIKTTGGNTGITNKGTITTHGHGIFSESGSNVNITNEANATITAGDIAPSITTINIIDAYGIASGGDNVVITNDGQVTVNGDVKTGATTTRGIGISSTGAGATIDNKKNIEVVNGGVGIYSRGSGAKIHNNENATISTDAVADSHGIHAKDANAIIITNTGTISAGFTKDASGAKTATEVAHGIFAEAGVDATITNEAGKTIDAGGEGIKTTGASSATTANTYIVTNRGVITSKSTGISATGAGVTISNMEDATITTTDDNGHGISATGSRNELSNIGAITTAGNSSTGIYSEGDSVAIANDGTIATAGNSSTGIYSEGNNAAIANTGTIETAGTTAHGISSTSNSGNANNAVITNDGTIATTGMTSHGINSTGGNATITNAKAIQTSGMTSHGINSTGNNANITNNESIATTGVDATGVILGGNDVTIRNMQDATITSENGGGISVGGNDNNLTNDGTITTQGGVAIYLKNTANNTTITNNGRIETKNPASNYAIKAEGMDKRSDVNLNDFYPVPTKKGNNKLSRVLGRIDLGGANDTTEIDTVNLNVAKDRGKSISYLFENTEVVNGVAGGEKIIQGKEGANDRHIRATTLETTMDSTRAIALNNLTVAVHRAIIERQSARNSLAKSPTAWGSVFGGGNKYDAREGAVAYYSQQVGFVGGHEQSYRRLRLGVVGGYGYSKTASDADSFYTRSNNFFAGVYGKARVKIVRLTASVLGGYSDTNNERSVLNALSNSTSIAKADFGSPFVSPSIGASIEHNFNKKISLRPSINAAYSVVWLSEYDESGSSANLIVNSRIARAFAAHVQIAGAYKIAKNAEVALRVGINARHTEQDSITANLNGGDYVTFKNVGDSDVYGGFVGAKALVSIRKNINLIADIEAGRDKSGDESYLRGQINLRYSF